MKYDKAISEALKILEEAQKPSHTNKTLIMITRVGVDKWENYGNVFTEAEINEGLESAPPSATVLIADFGNPDDPWPDSPLIPSQKAHATSLEFARHQHQQKKNYIEGVMPTGEEEKPLEEYDEEWFKNE